MSGKLGQFSIIYIVVRTSQVQYHCLQCWDQWQAILSLKERAKILTNTIQFHKFKISWDIKSAHRLLVYFDITSYSQLMKLHKYDINNSCT